MDHRRAAQFDVGAFHQRTKLAFVHAHPRARHQRAQPRIRQRRADAQPVDFLFGFAHAQLRVVGIEQLDLEGRFELAALGHHQRPDQADTFRAPPFQFLNGQRDALMLPPAHINFTGNLAAQRKMVEPFHVHDHAFAGLEHHLGFHRSRPTGHPLHGIAGAVIGHHQQVIAAVFLHCCSQCRLTARVLSVGKTRVLLLHHRLQTRLNLENCAHCFS